MAKFLLILLIVSFVVRFILPVILRLLVGRFVQKQARRYGQQFGGAMPFDGAFGSRPAPNSPPPGGGMCVSTLYRPNRLSPNPRISKGENTLISRK
ncbi:hypothetical protein [Hymenobacter cellulosilyticus]|uniref:DUF4834 family protein n=1 Tax=Hymenobacter cellulosilyticus TaxID=2932248 RepID=A0A8T9QFY3_9BACT|nr:hypothetical protein [Hymenobacter cellulosilyticus]UOQ73743.1 hypothetical protein MUN79_07440 [Hymenobacter cellulosilyticus]